MRRNQIWHEKIRNIKRNLFTKKYTDPSAPYDGYIEDDDTEESARNILLRKVEVK